MYIYRYMSIYIYPASNIVNTSRHRKGYETVGFGGGGTIYIDIDIWMQTGHIKQMV